MALGPAERMESVVAGMGSELEAATGAGAERVLQPVLGRPRPVASPA